MTTDRRCISGGAPKICFVAHNAYPALSGGPGHIGGVERLQSVMVRWLAARGWRVSMVTWDEGQPDEAVVDGVRVLKLCRRDAGLRAVRFFHPRWTSLLHALRVADADLYYQNCGEYVTGQVALWCRRHGRRFVYSVASDPDCDRRLPEMHTLRERILYRYGLRHADRIIVQTLRQQSMLREGFGLEAEVVPMPCPGPVGDEHVAPSWPDGGPGRVLWLGRLCQVKRPEWLLRLAQACDELRFDLVGPSDGSGPIQDVLSQAQRMANVMVHGRVSDETVRKLYRGAHCFCSTSVFEGFPNTFLEAWSHGLPVVSTFDPDGLIASRGLGAVAADVDGLAAELRALLVDVDRYREVSANARLYYLKNHTPDAVMRRFEDLFLAVAGR